MRREALHHLFELLDVKLNKGEFYIAPHLAVDFQNSLINVRISPDRMVDPASVDRRIKSLLLFIPYLKDRDEWRETVSLKQIQSAYFQQIGHAFDRPYRMMLETGSTPDEFSARLAEDPERFEEQSRCVDAFITDMDEFWELVPAAAWMDLDGFLAQLNIFAVDRLPDEPAGITEAAGIDFDIALLPDPFSEDLPALRRMDRRRRCSEVLRRALHVLRYRDIALSDSDAPRVAFLPPGRLRNESPSSG